MKARALVVVALAAIACSSKPKGELMLVIDSDMSPGVDFDKFEINITNNNYTASFTEFGAPGLKSFPATFAIADDGTLGGTVHFRVYAGKQSGGVTAVGAPMVLREFATTIPSDRIAALRVRLEWACVGNAYDKGGADHYVEGHCAEGSTCIAGTCVEWSIDSSALPTYSDDALGAGRCFDTIGCFAGATIVPLDAATCAIAKPPGTNVNVAIATSDGFGICDADVCFVPLDANGPNGWTDGGATIQLPPGLCRPAKGVELGRIRGVVVTTSCPAKTADLPTCGPWSAFDAGTLDARGPEGLPDAMPFPSDAGD